MALLTVPHVLLTAQGVLRGADRDELRLGHNRVASAASPTQGGADADGGPLSHLAYSALPESAAERQDAILFVDVCGDRPGPYNAAVAADLLDEPELASWDPVAGSFAFDLPTPAHAPRRYCCLVRGRSSDRDETISALNGRLASSLRYARRLGQRSHHLYVRSGDPDPAAELLAMELWSDPAGLQQFHRTTTIYAPSLTSLTTTLWEQARGGRWTEW